MAFYHVEVGYTVGKRKTGIALGMTVKAFNDDEAEEIARAHAFRGKKNPQWRYSDVREATPSDMACGVVND